MSNIKKILKKTGLYCIYNPNDFIKKTIKLRDNRNAILWVNKNDNHGILDEKYWEDSNFYYKDYRKEFSANIGKFTSSENHFEIYKEVNRRQFEQFSELINEDTALLEIGCSFGGILNHIDSKKIKLCHGIEPNILDAKFCEMKNKNCKIYNSLFEDHKFESKYNLIISFEVLEHVFDIKKFIEKLYSILEKDGIINFEVPNHNDALLVNYEVSRYQSFYYHKSHIHYFTPQSLIKIFSHFGIIGEVFGFQMYPFFNQIYWIYNNSPQNSAIEALSYPKVDKNKNPTNLNIYNFFEEVILKYQKLMNDNLSSDCLIFKGIKK